ncbi:hypothetical protein RHGRI_010409 [Rhododendron griersonianum]|uniref:Uncharacterized protein n=1 Tax=Rhododendron griersonianum TaxID=479676 RepID=A0AAV6KJ19_9ERIC|nr:hypothetical protein RHGRI_010409 [Rhododendron griersonianum]
MAPRKLIALGVGVASSTPPRGVTPGVYAAAGVAPAIGVALPIVAGVSSHLDLCRLGVGVASLASLGVASQVIPAEVAPGVTPPADRVTSESAKRPGVGVSSHLFLLESEGVASPITLPGVGVTSHLPIPRVESGKSQSDLAFFTALLSSCD